MLQQHIERLAEDLGIKPVPEKDQNGIFQLNFDPDLEIAIKEQDPGAYFYSVVCVCPEKNKEELLMKLMEANFLGQGTSGGVLGMEEDEKMIVLSQDFSRELYYEQFRERLEDFLNYVEYWRGEIEKHKKKNEENPY